VIKAVYGHSHPLPSVWTLLVKMAEELTAVNFLILGLLYCSVHRNFIVIEAILCGTQ
jgi:hypothetical protein